MTGRFNASGRNSGNLRQTYYSERRYPDLVFLSTGLIGTIPEPDFARDYVPGQLRKPLPDSDEQQDVVNYSKNLENITRQSSRTQMG